MREIKFRAWDVENSEVNGKMHYFNTMQVCDNGLWFNNDSFDLGESHCDDENAIVMQYTGLKDKNGKEIYEGDILIGVGSKPVIVNWNNHFASFCLDMEGWMYSHWFGESCKPEDTEIIGNIYEHPHLIK